MTPGPPRVVYDCNVLFQALISTKGPAHRCRLFAEEGRVQLFVSDYLFAELRDVAARPTLRRRFQLTPEKVETFLANLEKHAYRVTNVPEVYRHPVDFEDSHYINLAVAVDARLVVTRDNHLLNLMDSTRWEARDFVVRFPLLRIIEPHVLIKELADQQTQSEGMPEPPPQEHR